MKLYLSLNGTGIAGLQQFIDKQQKDNLSAKETIKYFLINAKVPIKKMIIIIVKS